MGLSQKVVFASCVALLPSLGLALPARVLGSQTPENQQASGPAQTARVVGSIRIINGSSLTLAPDKGPEIQVIVGSSTRFIQVAPGATNLKNATPAQLGDLQIGDRILAGGKLSDDGKGIAASTIVVMKQSDVAAKQEHDREDWQKHGIGGPVTAVNPSDGTIIISLPSAGGKKSLTIRTSSQTIIRRYAQDSVKFENAQLGKLSDIARGDQLRARGTRSAEGSELEAVEIVSGAFRNIAGTVLSKDQNANTLTVLDLAAKKPVTVRITPESQLRKLPPEVAQHIAMRLKAPSNGAAGATVSASGKTENVRETPESSVSPDAAMSPQQILSRAPSITLSDLQKGDAVMIVSTPGTAGGGMTAMTLVSGVEPILQASSKDGQGMILSPWSLGSGGEGEGP
jgi:hypothetical protein